MDKGDFRVQVTSALMYYEMKNVKSINRKHLIIIVPEDVFREIHFFNDGIFDKTSYLYMGIKLISGYTDKILVCETINDQSV